MNYWQGKGGSRFDHKKNNAVAELISCWKGKKAINIKRIAKRHKIDEQWLDETYRLYIKCERGAT